MNRFVEQFERDRRLATRHNLKTPLRVRIWKSDLPEERTESVNLSERGVYFATRSPISKGETIQVLLKMPEVVTGVPTTEWRCTGHVVRTEPRETKLGVGVQFDFYEVSGSERVLSPVVPASYGDLSTEMSVREARVRTESR